MYLFREKESKQARRILDTFFFQFLVFLVFSLLSKSSKTGLLHLGHLGSTSDSRTYMKHRGHPASAIEVASGLLVYCVIDESSGSEETHELSGDISEKETDVFGDPTCWLALGGERFSLKSGFGLFALRLIIFYLLNFLLSIEFGPL